MITVTIQRKYSVVEESRQWLKVSDDPGRNYDYVDMKVPVEKSTMLLSQTIEDDAAIDIGAVIKAVNNL